MGLANKKTAKPIGMVSQEAGAIRHAAVSKIFHATEYDATYITTGFRIDDIENMVFGRIVHIPHLAVVAKFLCAIRDRRNPDVRFASALH